MGTALLSWRRLAIASALVMVGAIARGQQPLSQVVTEGIGKRFPATAGQVNYDRWPLPLREAPGAMMTAAITPDGSLVATGCGHPGQSGELVLWDAATGRERWMRRYPRGIRSVVFTSDGSRLAAGSFDGAARIIDVASGKLLAELRGHTDAINGLALSGDDRTLATGSHDQTVIVWNVADGSRRHTLRGHTDDVLTVAISTSGKLLASAGRDNTLRLWNLETGETLHTLSGHEGLIEMVAFSPDDAAVASASWDGTVRVWATDTGKQRALLRRNTRVTSVAFSLDGKEIWCGGFDGQIAAWNPDAEGADREFKVQDGATYAVALSKDGTRIVTCGFEGTARLWKPDGTRIQSFDRQLTLADDARRIEYAVWSPNEQLIATVHGDDVLRLTRAADGAAAGELRLPDERIVSALFAGDGKTLFVATRDGGVRRWDPAAKADALTTMATHASAVTALALSPDGGALVSCAQDGSLEFRSIGGKAEASAKADSPAACAAVAAGGRVITGHADGRVRFWNIHSGREIASEFRLAQPARAMAIAPRDGTLAIAAGSSIELLEATFAGEAVKVNRRRALTVPEGVITHLAMVAGGEQLVSGDTSGQVRLWALTGGTAALPRKHAGGVTALAIAPASHTLLTCGADRAAWLWQSVAEAQAIRPLASIPAHEKGTRYVALAKKNRLVSDGHDNHVRIWNLATGQQERDLGVPDAARACVLMPGGTGVAVGHWSKRISLVELDSGQRLDNIRGLPRGPYVIALAPKLDRMAAAFRELGAMVYDLTADEADPVVTLAADELPFTHIDFAPDGGTFVTCTGDYQRMELAGKVRLHDAKTGAVVRSFVGHTSEVKHAAFDAEGKRLITASGDKTVRVWDVASGEMQNLLPHPIGTFAPIFVPESDLALTADYHGKVYLWDLRTSTLVQTVFCHADLVCRVSLSDDLSVLASGSRDGTVKLWKLSGLGNELRIVDAAAGSASSPENAP